MEEGEIAGLDEPVSQQSQIELSPVSGKMA